MIGSWRNRLRRAQKENERLREAQTLAKEALRIEGENTIMKTQIGMMESVQKQLVNAEIKGLKQGLKKQLPQITQARQESGEKQMTHYLTSVKSRALSQSK